MAETLTDRQREVLEFVRVYIAERKYPPTVREIMDHFGLFSPNGVVCHLKALQKKFYIEWTQGIARSIRLTDAATAPTRGLPVIDLSKVDRA